MALTEIEKKLIDKFLADGKTKEEIPGLLNKARAKLGLTDGSFMTRVMQNLKAAPEALFGKESVSQKILGKVPVVGDLLNKVPEAIESASSMAIEGTETGVKGVREIAKGIPEIAGGVKTGIETGDWQQASDAVVDTVGGTTKVIGGGLETAFAVPVAVLQEFPYGEEALTAISEGVNTVSSGLGNALGVDEKSKQVLTESFNNLFMLLGAKYGPKATETLKSSLAPYITKAGEKTVSIAKGLKKTEPIQPLPEVTKTASEQGVDLPISATTGSEFIRSMEALQKNGIFSGELLAKSEAATAKIADLTAKATEKLDTTDLTRFDFGNIAKEGFEKVKDTFKETKSDLYDAADVALTGSKVKGKFIAKPAETLAALDELISSSKKSLAPTSATKFWGDLKSGFSSGKITVETLRQTLKDIGKKMGDQNDPIVTGDRAAFSKVYASLSKDLDAFYTEKAPAFKEAITAANSYFKENLELINGKFGSMVEKATPEQIYDKFVRPNNPTALGQLKEVIGGKNFAKISGVFLKDLLEKSVKNEKFSIDIFNKEIGKWDAKTLKVVLDKKQLARLEDVKSTLGSLKTLNDAMKFGEAKFKGSQTGFLNAVNKLKTLFAGGAGLGAFSAWGLPGVILSATLYILGDFATAKLLKSEFMKKLVSTGIKVPGTGSAKVFGEFLTKNADTISQIMSGTSVTIPVVAPIQPTGSDMEPLAQE